MNESIKHFNEGIGIWDFASKEDPDIIIASAGDTPTVEALAAVQILNEEIPNIKVRYINVIDLMALKKDHDHGITDEKYNSLFTKNKQIIFAFHGYPSLIKTLTYERHNKKMSIHGYIEEGTITTPFDMRVRNEIDRYHLVLDVIEKLNLTKKHKETVKKMKEKLKKHKKYIEEKGIDTEEIRNWTWKW